MATQIDKALDSKKGQQRIRSKASAIARAKVKAAEDKLRAKLKKARSSAKPVVRDLVSIGLDPVLTGAAGATALDVACKFAPLPLDGARGDLIKAGAAIAVGYLARGHIKTPYLQNAAIGAAIVNANRLAMRVVNRAQAGQLSSLFTDHSDMDLAGLAGLAAVPKIRPVGIRFEGGHVEPGFVDQSGQLFDRNKRLIIERHDEDREALDGIEEDEEVAAFEAPEYDALDV